MKTKLLLILLFALLLIVNCSSSQRYELKKQTSTTAPTIFKSIQIFQDEKYALINSDIIDLEKKVIVRSFKNASRLFLSNDNKTIISPIVDFSKNEGGFYFYDISTGKEIKNNIQANFYPAIGAGSITDDGKILISHDINEIYDLESFEMLPGSWYETYEATKQKILRSDIVHPHCPCRIFSNDSIIAYYIFGSKRQLVKVNIKTGEFVPIINLKNDKDLLQLSISDDKSILAAIVQNNNQENDLILYDTTSSRIKMSMSIKKWTDDVKTKYFNVVFSPNNELFIYGNKLYSVRDGSLIKELAYYVEKPFFLKKNKEVIFSPTLTNSNNANTIIQYLSLDTGKEVIEKRIYKFTSSVGKIEYKKDSNNIFALSSDNSIKYDIKNHKVGKVNAFVNAYTTFSSHNKKAFTLDEKGMHILDLENLQTELISDKLDQVVKILDDIKNRNLEEMKGFPIYGSSLIRHTDSPDGRFIVTYWTSVSTLRIMNYIVWDVLKKTVFIDSYENKIQGPKRFDILGILDNGELIGMSNSGKLATVNYESFIITKNFNYPCSLFPSNKLLFLNKDLFWGKAYCRSTHDTYYDHIFYNLKEDKVIQSLKFDEIPYEKFRKTNNNSIIAGFGSYSSSYIFWNIETGSVQKSAKIPEGILDFSPEIDLVLKADGSIGLSNEQNNSKLSIIPSAKNSIIISNNKNQYMTIGKDAYNLIQFSKGLDTYSFELFDISNNRPDIILNSLAELTNDESLKPRAAYYKKLWQLRVKQNGYSPEKLENQGEVHFPEAKITEKPESPTATERKISFSFRLKDDESTSLPIVGYKVFVNGVPIYGDYIRRVTPDGSVINDSSVTIKEYIDLSQGANKIEVSGFTSDGHESPRDTFTIYYNSKEQRVPDLYYIGIGVNSYDANKTGGLDALTYAVKDSRELKDTFEKSGKGKFANVYTKVLNDSEVTRENIGKLKDFLKNSQVDDQVIVFLSGHGIRKDTKVSDLIKAFGDTVPPQYKLRDGGDVDDVYYYMTSTANVDKPWENAIPLDGIRELVNGIPSRQKILLVDTCQSGEKLDLDEQTVASLTKNIEIRKTRGQTAKTRGLNMTTKPGASNEKAEDTEKKIIQSIAKSNALKEMSELFPELRRGTGTIEISAATGAQSALESKEWQNGAFTFVIKEAILKGKAKDEKGNITARSLRKYVLDEVEKLTDGQQTPMVARDIAGRDFVIFGR